MMESAIIDRDFVRIGAGLVHYRSAGTASNGEPPLYMAHSSPGSSLGLVPMIAELGNHRRVIAPDMLGNGDSDPPLLKKTDIAYYVDCVIRILDKLNIDQVDFYGQHTGAHIGCELALTYPDRVRMLALDGVPLFPAELKTQLLEHYAPQIEPDDFGGHLAWVWTFVRDLTLHFPYFLRDPEHRLHQSAVPPPQARQALAVDVLKALSTYHLAYGAAFAHPMADRLPLLQHRTLLMAVDSDPLAAYLDQASALLPSAHKKMVARAQRAAAVQDFLAS